MEVGPSPSDNEVSASAQIDHLTELAEQTRVGEVYLAALMRRQLRLSLGVAVSLLAVLGVQPLLDRWVAYRQAALFSIPVPWLVLGLLTYPLLVVAGYFYLGRSESIDDEFGDLMR
ncbi:MAG TPA: hypothetical protein VNI34_01085 [Candidatus Nitrosotalea sp.]|nr:hypothetical protein [Candidatus Nitrosotalea sp.]